MAKRSDTPGGTTSRPHGKTPERGAAMLEAIFVITTLLVFLGGTLFIRDAYLAKLGAQHTARRDTLAYASHNCESGALEAAVSRSSEGGPQGGGLDADGTRLANRGQGQGLAGAEAINESWGVARTSTSKPATRDAVVGAGTGLQRVPLSKNVTGKATVFCNEKPVDGDLAGWFGFMASMITQGPW